MGQCSVLKFSDYNINIVIADGNPYSFNQIPTHCDMLIIGRNCQWTISLLHQLYNPDLVIIHSSLLPHLRKRITLECEARQIPVYSLAEDGPLALDFTKTFVPAYML